MCLSKFAASYFLFYFLYVSLHVGEMVTWSKLASEIISVCETPDGCISALERLFLLSHEGGCISGRGNLIKRSPKSSFS